SADVFCRCCGMSVSDTLSRHAQQAALLRWLYADPRRDQPYRPAATRRTVLVALLLGAAGLAAVAGVAHVALAVQESGPSRSTLPDPSSLRHVLAVAQTAGALLAFAGVVVLASWATVVHRNLTALGVAGQRLSAGWAAAGWLVPGYNLVHAKLVLDESWRGSAPNVPPLTSSWRNQPAPLWTTTASSGVVVAGTFAAASLAVSPRSGAVTTVDTVRAEILAALAALVLLGVALSLLVVVRRVAGLQDRRAEVVVVPTLHAASAVASVAPAPPPPVLSPTVDAAILLRPPTPDPWGRY
ncbi:MAG: DUF4328 domain-containing protein, partial [Acidimicrobiales bacterium]|nr:DUF4328 domain-containing protein [Acidimicrobiales bacterium]